MTANSDIIRSTSAQEPRTFLRWSLFGLVLIVAFGIFLWSNTAYDIDDAPITYRYADNIVEGHGFVYNPDERILGTSTPLYTLLLASLGFLGISSPTASNVLNLLGSVALVAATMALAWRLNRSFLTSLLAGVFLVTQDSFLRYSMAGMETPVYTLLIVSSLLAFAGEKTLLSAVLAGLASLMRLDGFAVVGAVLLGCWVRQRRFPLRESVVVALVLAPWILFSSLYFGSPVPLSMLAKQHHLEASHGTRFWIWDWLFAKPLHSGKVLLPFVLVGLLHLRRRGTNFPTWIAVTSWLGAYLIAYTVVGIDFYEWYLVPVYPVWVCLGVVGLSAVFKALRGFAGQRRLVLAVLSIAFLVLLLFPYVRHAYLSVDGYKRYLLSLERTRALAGEWLRDSTDPASQIKAGAIGHVGFVSKRYIIDSAGLVTTAKQLAELKPDYWVLDYPYRGKECGPVKDFDTGWPNHPRLTISRCSEVKARFDTLVLAEVRVTNWVSGLDGTWYRESRPFLETQWLVQDSPPERDWTLYVHFTRQDGTMVAQADHTLGLQAVGSVISTTQWPTDRRIYDYVPLPAGIQNAAFPVQVRVGVWDPATGEHVQSVPVSSHTDEHGRLVIEVTEP